jgi:hypothetical protein
MAMKKRALSMLAIGLGCLLLLAVLLLQSDHATMAYNLFWLRLQAPHDLDCPSGRIKVGPTNLRHATAAGCGKKADYWCYSRRTHGFVYWTYCHGPRFRPAAPNLRTPK